MKRSNKNKNGFSFIEVILSVFILSTAMVAVLGLMTSNLRDSLDIIDQETAGFLAQEGVELVRNVRDNNWKNDLPSFDVATFPANSVGAKDCVIDKDDINILTCLGSFNQQQLKINANGFYVNLPAAGTDTRFARKIDITYLPDDTTKSYAEVTSMVVWKRTDFPPDTTTCNAANRCAFVTLTLSTWGE